LERQRDEPGKAMAVHGVEFYLVPPLLWRHGICGIPRNMGAPRVVASLGTAVTEHCAHRSFDSFGMGGTSLDSHRHASSKASLI
jgi:hypothetical protein